MTESGFIRAYDINIEEVVPHLFFIRGNDVLWSIGPEMTFYITFAILLTLRANLAILLVSLAAAYALLVAESVPSGLLDTEISFIDNYKVYQFFAAGPIALGLYRMGDKLNPDFDILIAIAFSCIFIASFPQVHVSLFGTQPPGWGWDTTQYLILCIVAIYLSLKNQVFITIFSTHLMRYIGRVSFALYLVQMLIIQIFDKFGLLAPNVMSLAGVAIVSVATSALIFQFYERPMQRILKRIAAGFRPIAI